MAKPLVAQRTLPLLLETTSTIARGAGLLGALCEAAGGGSFVPFSPGPLGACRGGPLILFQSVGAATAVYQVTKCSVASVRVSVCARVCVCECRRFRVGTHGRMRRAGPRTRGRRDQRGGGLRRRRPRRGPQCVAGRRVGCPGPSFALTMRSLFLR